MIIVSRLGLRSKTMIVHRAAQITKDDTTITTTLCGRSNRKSMLGFNSADNPEEVTCKLCQKIQSDPKHWRVKKYLNK